MPRKLRIAVSVFFGLLTVALCVLWVRSYWRVDKLEGNWSANCSFDVMSMDGELIYQSQCGAGVIPNKWQYTTYPFPGGHRPGTEREVAVVFGKGATTSQLTWYKYWFPTFVSGILAIVFGIPYVSRFSLRTLLIATTLVAVVLGLSVWLTR